MSSADLYTDRTRAEGFGAQAAGYDATRPSYPPELVAWLARGRPGVAVDVGSGTGRVARLLIDAGWSVTAIEPDARMADVARSHGVQVINTPFERCPLPAGTCDLVCSGTAWHWIDPAVGYRMAATLLRPGGRLAVFRNTYFYAEDLAAAFDRVLEEHAPHLHDDCIPLGTATHGSLESEVQALMERSGLFADVAHRTFVHQRQIDVHDWLTELGTFSQFALLDDATRERLLAALVRAVRSKAGGRLHIRHESRYVEGTRVPDAQG